jgi:hypothetical protein
VVNWTRNGATVAEQVALVNAPQFMASDLAEVVYQRTGADSYKMVAIWCTGKDGDVTVSVRSRERPGDIHCGNLPDCMAEVVTQVPRDSTLVSNN